LRGVEPAERSAASISRLLRGVGRSDRVRVLGELARSGSVAERVAAIQVLGSLREPAAAPELGALVAESADDGVRAAALVALGRTGDRIAAPAMRDIVASGSSVVREAAADALGLLGDREAVQSLTELSSYPSAPVRAAAARALGRIGDATAVDALATLAADADRRVRARARVALMTSELEAHERGVTRRSPRPMAVGACVGWSRSTTPWSAAYAVDQAA
jgi:HEAT repeat protein